MTDDLVADATSAADAIEEVARNLHKDNFVSYAQNRADANRLRNLAARITDLEAKLREIRQDMPYVMGWNAGFDHALNETIKLKFPTMLRKMWSGREVAEWLNKAQDKARRAAAAMEGK